MGRRREARNLFGRLLPGHSAPCSGNPGVGPTWESNWRPLGSQAGTQSTEPHQPGKRYSFQTVKGKAYCCLERGLEAQDSWEAEAFCFYKTQVPCPKLAPPTAKGRASHWLRAGTLARLPGLKCSRVTLDKRLHLLLCFSICPVVQNSGHSEN